MSDTLTATQVGKKIRLVWTYTPAPSWPDAQGNIYKEHLYKEMWQEGYMQGATAEVDATTYPLAVYITAYGQGLVATWVTIEKIDLTGYTALKVIQDAHFDAYYGEGWSLWDGYTPFSLDVSSLTGEFYIRLCIVGSMFGGNLYVIVSTDQYGDETTYDAIGSVRYGGYTYIGRVWLE